MILNAFLICRMCVVAFKLAKTNVEGHTSIRGTGCICLFIYFSTSRFFFLCVLIVLIYIGNLISVDHQT
jgi:hypothetical protein